MIALDLFRHLARRQAPFLIASGLLFGLFELLICKAVTSADIGGALEALMKSLPSFARSVLATQFFGGLSQRGLLAFGWNHPVAHALGTAAAIVLASRAVAGEIESGAMELLLSQPLSRATYLSTHVIFAVLALALMSLAGMAGTLLGQSLFRMEPFRAGQFASLALNYFLLQGAWYGVTLAITAFRREGGRVAGMGFLLALASYFGQVIGRVWDGAAFLLPWTLQDYFSPQGILIEGASLLRPLATLLAVALAGLGVAAWQFERRDLP